VPDTPRTSPNDDLEDALEKDVLEKLFRIMELYIAQAKTYSQLSGGALILTVAFSKEVLGVAEDQAIEASGSLIATWLFFLGAVVAGVTYQYLAVRFLELKAEVPVHHRVDWPLSLRSNPWILYAIMMLAFYLGAAFFTLTAILGLIGT